MNTNEQSGKEDDWNEFSAEVVTHIREYVIPQYGDKGDDLASEYSLEECRLNLYRYITRLGKNSREHHDAMDCLKIAHYAQMTYHKLVRGQKNSYGPEQQFISIVLGGTDWSKKELLELATELKLKQLGE